MSRRPALLLGRDAAAWSAALGLSRRTVQRYIAGRPLPPTRVLVTMARVAGVTVDAVIAALGANP